MVPLLAGAFTLDTITVFHLKQRINYIYTPQTYCSTHVDAAFTIHYVYALLGSNVASDGVDLLTVNTREGMDGVNAGRNNLCV